MAEIDKDRLYRELLGLHEQLGLILDLTRENLTLCKEINQEMAVGRLKVDAARAACEGRILA